MSLVPRTFRFDKYQFHGSRDVERVSAVEAPREVGEGARPELKRRPPGRPVEGRPEQPDRFRDSQIQNPEWSTPYFKTRSLWNPLEDPNLLQNPTEILVGFEGTEAGQVNLRAALQLAERYHCRLTVLQVFSGNEKDLPGLQATLARQVEEIFLEVSNHDYAKKYPPVLQVKTQTDPVEGILRQAHQGKCSLIVVGDRRPDKTDPTGLGSISLRVMKQAPCPVLVWPHSRPSLQIKNVMVPTDGTTHSYPA